MRPCDQDARDRALDPRASFIVRAPAGSGKTGLLIQRCLALLATVERPESVVAITFTVKAAGEMRRRVLAALASADGPPPEDAHDRRTWELARAVRERDGSRGWNIAANPHRLEIRTIDSLCAAIVRRMPWTSRLGPPPRIVEDSSELVREAARRTVSMLEEDQWSEPIGRLLAHVDNDVPVLQDLVSSMLLRRDQWLRITGAGNGDREAERAALEATLQNVIVSTLERLRASFPPDAARLPRFADRAARLAGDDVIVHCAGLRALPEASVDALPAWRGIVEIICTAAGKRRKTVNANQGFPPGSDKQAFLALLEQLDDDLCADLHKVRSLPPARYDDRQWAIVDALLRVLPLAVAQLHLVFRERGVADFAEIALRALEALGDLSSGLAFAFDSLVEHLLVDEFQDTSYSQFDLLATLTAGWQPGDGRTLFLVGDPMQSIYRFREAEVGLFLRAETAGIAGLPLEPLRLAVNFRSDRGIVEWVNQTFPRVMPAANDAPAGAVSFEKSEAAHPADAVWPVTLHPIPHKDDEAEARYMAEIVRAARAADANARIAILVRARTHLPTILRALRTAGLRYQAIEIDSLPDLPVIQDLLALTRALVHPADRVAWLAVLRAPWCGLTLADLHALAGDALDTTVWDLVRDDARMARLSPAGAAGLRRARAVLSDALAARPSSLRDWVQGAWIALGGPACAAGEEANASAFFSLLEDLDEGCDVSLDELDRRVRKLYAAPDPDADGTLQVMTIHKAKGLEFDVVIVPGLGRRARSDDPRLMLWAERPGDRSAELLLAPIRQTGEDKDALYEFVKSFDRDKERHEIGRLLYVACTRAKKQLHLLGSTRWKDGAVCKPESSSMLRLLWETVEADFTAVPPPQPEPHAEAAPPRQTLRRLPAGWQLPSPPPGIELAPHKPASEVDPDANQPSFRWVGDTLRHIGTVVHAMLHEIAREGVQRWDSPRVEESRHRIEAALRARGVGAEELPDAAAKVLLALRSTLADPNGRWILDAGHRDASSELALTGFVDGKLANIRIDRTFVDSGGTRWIVDFKTSSHAGGSVEDFIANEIERHRPQLNLYRRLLSWDGNAKIRTVLYFPLLGRMESVEPER